MAAKRILILADDPADGENLALDLSRAGYVTPIAGFRDLPHLKMPEPDLVIICLSPTMECALDLAQGLKEMKGVPLLVVSALGLSHLEGSFRGLPHVSAVLFKPYSGEDLLKAVRETRTTPLVQRSPALVWR